MDVRMLVNQELDISSKTGKKTKKVCFGFTYPVKKVVFEWDGSSADIYFAEGCAENIPQVDFELSGNLDSVEYKEAPKPSKVKEE